MLNPSAWRTEMRKKPIHLFLDFDGTLTYSDTLETLSSIGYAREGRRPTAQQPAIRSWDSIVKAYMNDFRTHESAYRPAKHERTTVERQRGWLRSLKPVETASAKRALEAGVWDRLSREDLHEATRYAVQTGEVKCRAGALEFIRSVNAWNHSLGSDTKVDVLSVNWSRRFIWDCITSAALMPGSSGPVEEDQINMRIYANELPSIEAERAQRMERPYDTLQGKTLEVRTSQDKVEQMVSLGNDNTRDHEIIYVGDSDTDLECLLRAHLGICIRDEQMGSSQKDLAETCERIGVHVRPLRELCEGDGSPSPNTLFYANDFAEIEGCLLGIVYSKVK